VSSPTDLIGARDAAEILGVSVAHVHNLVHRYGFLTPTTRVGQILLFRRADVERLAREGWPGRRQQRPRSA
jgi:hypothetical protein